MYIETTNSTNTLLKQMLPQEEYFAIWAGEQTAGRGQAGNGWESEKGKNLTMSVLLRPSELTHGELFRLNMLVSIAVLRSLTLDSDCGKLSNGAWVSIKWPNDIYIGDKKVCGILIENIFSGSSQCDSIVGIGLNVNQTVFVSNAPNPTSLLLETGQTWDIRALKEQIVAQLKALRPLLQQPELLKSLYMDCLYRREGFWPYVEREVSLSPTMPLVGGEAQRCEREIFEARIADVADDGCLVLETRDGEQRTYHFKQVRYVLTND